CDGIGGVWVVALLLPLALYMPVRWFAALKARRRDLAWLKYLVILMGFGLLGVYPLRGASRIKITSRTRVKLWEGACSRWRWSVTHVSTVKLLSGASPLPHKAKKACLLCLQTRL
ncbi:hypothetical protein F0170_04530, partial [Pseudomonas sp. MAFF 730085]|nr:hypothetical protein [Pseudomonas kitaguniensis]